MSKRIEIPPRDTKAPVRIPHKGRPEPSSQKPKKPSGVFNERHTLAQDGLYRDWMAHQTAIVITFDDGATLEGTLQSYDTYALHIQDVDGLELLVFKQAVRIIKPSTKSNS